MQMKTCETAFLGASAWAAGYTAAHPDEQNVILEQSAVLSPEFAGAFRADSIASPTTPEGKLFWDDLLARNLLAEDGRISIPAVTPYFAQVLLSSAATVLLMTHVYAVEESAEGYIVRYINTDGYGTLCCRRLVDTRARSGGRITQRAMLAGNGVPIDGYDKNGIRILHGRFDREYILAMDCTEDGFAARAAYRQRWALLCHTDFAGWETAALAAFPAREYPTPIWEQHAKNRWYIPSASYPHVMAAYEGGARCVLQ